MGVSHFECSGGGSLTWHVPASNTCTYSGSTSPQSGSASIGTASTDRVVVACISYIGAAATSGEVITAVTANGASLTKAVDSFVTSGAQRLTAIWYGNVTSGSGAQALSFTASNGFFQEGAITVGYFTGSATASVSSTQNASPPGYPTTIPAAGSVTIGGSGRIGVACGFNDPGSSTTVSWTGAASSSSDTDYNDGGSIISSL
jgi:hypothetical protein